MALYRKYRPATFAEVVGQEHVTEPLSTALDSGRINHAYLFSGPRGCGKTSSARILARSLNCEQGPTSTPCGVCNSCIALAPGGPGNLDVTEMDAASHGGVDDARELRDRAFYAPAESRYRVFIVDEAHMVTPQGFNALLKIVEEPPEHLIFIFATTEPEKVLTTIRSRTHHYPFRLLAPAVMRPLLERICGAESVPVEPAVYPLVIRAGGGSPRDSLSIMDQLLAGAGPEGVTYQRALGLLGVTDVALIDSAVDALAESDGAALFGAVERVMDAGHDPRRFAMDLLERLRDLILLNTVPDAADRGLIDVPVDVLDQMRSEASRLGLGTLTRCAEVTHASLAEMRGATSPRLLLEVMCARMLLPGADDSHAALLQRVEVLERRPVGASGGAPAPAGGASDAPAGDQRFVRPSQRPAQPAQQAEQAEQEPVPVPVPPTRPVPEPPVPQAAESAPPPQPEPVAEPASPQPEPVAEPAPPPVDQTPEGVPVMHRPAGADERATDPVPAEPAAPAPREWAPSSPDPTRPQPRPQSAATRPAQPAAPQPPAARPAPGPGVTVEQIRGGWPRVLRAVNTRSRVLGTLMANVQVGSIVGDTLHLTVGNPALRGRFHDPQHAQTLRDAVREVFGPTWEVEVGDGAGAPATPSAPVRQAAAPQRKAQPRFERPSRAGQQPPTGQQAPGAQQPPGSQPGGQSYRRPPQQEPSGQTPSARPAGGGYRPDDDIPLPPNRTPSRPRRSARNR
ncbi:DNA polymerase III subunit gamma and tau [Tsukamurella soli]|uniref:DNA polymerase III subunit gamma and tau n=1 Tax=Tsukamurella soli TaxID=644556 RepID=UPI003619ABF2